MSNSLSYTARDIYLAQVDCSGQSSTQSAGTALRKASVGLLAADPDGMREIFRAFIEISRSASGLVERRIFFCCWGSSAGGRGLLVSFEKQRSEY